MKDGVSLTLLTSWKKLPVVDAVTLASRWLSNEQIYASKIDVPSTNNNPRTVGIILDAAVTVTKEIGPTFSGESSQELTIRIGLVKFRRIKDMV